MRKAFGPFFVAKTKPHNV